MAKQNKHERIRDKANLARQNEKIISDFLLQFAYTLTIGVISIFMYNGIAMVGYGLDTHNSMVGFMQNIALITFVLGIVFAVWYKLKKKNGLKILSVYSFVTTIVSLWYVSHKVADFLGDKLHLSFVKDLYIDHLGITKSILLIFPALGLALIVEFAVYFIRYYKLNGKKKK